jgi:hypothetical protein
MNTPPSRARGAALALCALLSTALAGTHAHAERPPARRARADLARRAPPPAPRVALEDRRRMALERFLRNDSIRSCWTRQLYRDPTTASRRLAVALSIDATGRITAVRVRDAMAPALASCIMASGGRVAPVGPGEAFEADGALTLERGE